MMALLRNISDSRGSAPYWKAQYVEVSDDGLDQEIIQERTEREQGSLRNFWKMTQQPGGRFYRGEDQDQEQNENNGGVVTLADVQEWLFTDHKAYASHPDMTPDDQDFSQLSMKAMLDGKKNGSRGGGADGLGENGLGVAGPGSASPPGAVVSGALLSSY